MALDSSSPDSGQIPLQTFRQVRMALDSSSRDSGHTPLKTFPQVQMAFDQMAFDDSRRGGGDDCRRPLPRQPLCAYIDESRWNTEMLLQASSAMVTFDNVTLHLTRIV